MSAVHIAQVVAFLNNGEHIIYGSYTNDHDVLKKFSVCPGGSTNLFIIEEAEDCRNSDFSRGRTYPVTLQRGKHKRYVTYPPEDGARELEMNAPFEAPAPLTFVNTGADIVAVSYANSRGGTSAFHIAPDNQEQAANFSSREGACKAVTLQRGAHTEHMEYEAADSPIDVNAAFAVPARRRPATNSPGGGGGSSSGSSCGAAAAPRAFYTPVNRGADTIVFAYTDASGAPRQVSVPPRPDRGAGRSRKQIAVRAGTDCSVRRCRDIKVFPSALVRELADGGTGEFDVSELYQRAAWRADDAHAHVHSNGF